MLPVWGRGGCSPACLLPPLVSLDCPEPFCHPSPWRSPLRDHPLCPQVHYLQRPIALWCGLNHSLVLSQGSDFSKELLGCGCGAGGRLPGWPKGSASFVKLHIKVRAQVPTSGQEGRAGAIRPRGTGAGDPTRTQGPHFPAPPTSLSSSVPWFLALPLS